MVPRGQRDHRWDLRSHLSTCSSSREHGVGAEPPGQGKVRGQGGRCLEPAGRAGWRARTRRGRTAGRPGTALTPPTAPGGFGRAAGSGRGSPTSGPAWHSRSARARRCRSAAVAPAWAPGPTYLGRSCGPCVLELLLRALSCSTRPASGLGRPGPWGRCGSFSTGSRPAGPLPAALLRNGDPPAPLPFSSLPFPSFTLCPCPSISAVTRCA